MRITYHHNSWNDVNSRCPSIRFGTLHVYSSCYEDNPDSGIAVRMGANALVEETYFKNTDPAIGTDIRSGSDGYATSRNNIFVDSDVSISQASNWTPSYSYT